MNYSYSKNTDYLGFRILTAELNHPHVEVTAYLVNKYVPSIPIIKPSALPLSWKVEQKYVRKIIDVLSKVSKTELLAAMEYVNRKELSFQAEHLTSRKEMYELLNKKTMLLALVWKHSVDYTGVEPKPTVCLTKVFNYETGKKLTDHIWVSFKTHLDGTYPFKDLPVKTWVVFLAVPKMYSSVACDGSIHYKVRLSRIKAPQVVTPEDVIVWAKRKKQVMDSSCSTQTLQGDISCRTS